MWIIRLLIFIAVSVALGADVEEELSETLREARYAKNERPLLLIRPVRPPPAKKMNLPLGTSLTSTLGSSLSKFLPKLGFDWGFLRQSNKPKVTYKIVNNFPKEPSFPKATPLSPLHTSFKADFEAMSHKKKYPAYNPKPVLLDPSFFALPLKKSEEPEPVILPKSPTHEPLQVSQVIIGKPSSSGVNIPPYVEASLIENDKGVYHDLTGEISPSVEPYKFDFGGQELMLESKPISLSPSLQPKEHFKFTRDQQEPDFTFASDDVINIVNPPSQKDEQKSAKVSFAPSDAINIVKAPKEYLPERSRQSQKQTERHHFPPTVATPDFLQKRPSNLHFNHHKTSQTSPQTYLNSENTYEVFEKASEERRYPFLPPSEEQHHIGIGKYMEDARKVYMDASRKAKEALKYRIPKLHVPKNQEDEVEIITEAYQLTNFDLPAPINFHRSVKKGKIYQDSEEKYFADLEKKFKDDMETDEYFLPKREPVYNLQTPAAPTAPTFNFHPSMSISFGEDDAKANPSQEIDQKEDAIFFPPQFEFFHQKEERPNVNHVPDFIKLSVKPLNFTGSYHQPTTTETPESHPPENFNYFPPDHQYYLPPTQDYPKDHPEENDFSQHDFTEQKTEEFFSWTSTTPKYTKSPQDLKENHKKLSLRPTFFVKITTTAPPLGKRASPTSISCERRCIQTTVTQEYLPVCGSDGKSYSNRGKLACANNCGMEEIHVQHIGSCTPTK